MIATRFIRNIIDSFPRGQISWPIFGQSYVFDTEGAAIGYFNYRSEIFYLFTNYEFYKMAKASLKDHKVEVEETEQTAEELLFVRP